MHPARKVDVQYRQNVEYFRTWEEEKKEAQKQAIEALKRRERAQTAFKPPLWLVGLSAVFIVCIVGWLFTILVFSQESVLLP